MLVDPRKLNERELLVLIWIQERIINSLIRELKRVTKPRKRGRPCGSPNRKQYPKTAIAG